MTKFSAKILRVFKAVWRTMRNFGDNRTSELREGLRADVTGDGWPSLRLLCTILPCTIVLVWRLSRQRFVSGYV